MKELAKLNEKYYLLFNDLSDAAPALPERQYDLVAKILQQQYLEELDICLTENMLDVGVRNFELKFKAKNYLPRRAFLRWNKMAKALLRDYKVAFKEFLDNWKQEKKDQHEQTDKQIEADLPKEDISSLPVPTERDVVEVKEESK